MARRRPARSRRKASDTPDAAPAAVPEPADAVCFTSGFQGASFGAGVIHAWIAADRKPPEVIAGISMGSLTAAAMQRSLRAAFRERRAAGAPGESARWSWFRRYLEVASHSPLKVLWQALPDPVDFFADRPPVVDPSCPPSLRAKEAEARVRYYLLVKLGRWLAGLPISVSRVATNLIAYVRCREGYGLIWPLRWAHLLWSLACALALLLFHVCASPQWVSTPVVLQGSLFRKGRIPFRPLFGWGIWALSVFIVLVATPIAILTVLAWRGLLPEGWRPWVLESFEVLAAFALVPVAGYVLRWLARRFGAVGRLVSRLGIRPPSLTRRVLDALAIRRGVVSDYALSRALFDLFTDDAREEPRIEGPRGTGSHLLIVAAPLQNRERARNQQVTAAEGASLVDALRTALSLPGLCEPQSVEGLPPDTWFARAPFKDSSTELVDGAAIRTNPLPALFDWLKAGQHRDIARSLCGGSTEEARVHVVYSVPLVPREETEAGPERFDVVHAAKVSLALAQRRDTRLEVRQTNFMSRIEAQIACNDGSAGKVLPIFADEIAPEQQIRFKNPLDPTRDEFLENAAHGCRQTLETLYRERIPVAGCSCRSLLREVAPARREHLGEQPGLHEICRLCPGRLTKRSHDIEARTPGVLDSYGLRRGELRHQEFPHLDGTRPRIVFVASGGVFRGAFHIGVVGALHSIDVHPDLVVGASVGTLIGGALAAVSVLPRTVARGLLGELCDTFLHVDHRIALTRTLKEASRELGVRARSVGLSPAQLRRLIVRGSRSDPGYAAVGAPPALVDAISDLFLIPHQDTRDIAAQFVAGRISAAVHQFLEQVRRSTLRRLEITHAVMGTTLLEPRARHLLGGGLGIALDRVQPYHLRRRGEGGDLGVLPRNISVFSTTSDLISQTPLLLGRDFLRECVTYDFVKASLSSSAFPAVFSPVQEAAVLPGLGRTDILFSDGGMFDNLPFFPATEILADVQSSRLESFPGAGLAALRQRHREPDLFIAAALNADQTVTSSMPDFLAVAHRASALAANVKLDAFVAAAKKVDAQIGRLLEAASAPGARVDEGFVNRIVNAATLKIAPSGKEQINPTFAFCRSVGLKPKRVQRSIADGCFRTFASLVEGGHADGSPTKRSLEALRERKRVPSLRARPDRRAPRGICPFFEVNGAPHACPFFETHPEVRRECVKDADHDAAWKRLVRQPGRPPGHSRWSEPLAEPASTEGT